MSRGLCYPIRAARFSSAISFVQRQSFNLEGPDSIELKGKSTEMNTSDLSCLISLVSVWIFYKLRAFPRRYCTAPTLPQSIGILAAGIASGNSIETRA